MQSELRHGWKPLMAATLGVACGASPIPFNVLPVVIGPIHTELGWSFAAISFGATCYGIVGALAAPAIGALIDRRGVKPVAMTALTLFGLAFAAMYFVPPMLLAFYALWVVIGLVGIGSTPVSWSRAIGLWFHDNRGLALGIMLLGTSLTALVVPRLANSVLETAGWRAVFPAMAALPLLVALPIAAIFFREPRPDELPREARGAQGEPLGLPFAAAIRDRRFWLLFGSVCLVALAYGGAHIHMIQIVTLKGFAPDFAASVLSLVALGILVGRVSVGMLFDRFWAPGIAFPVLLLPVVACYLLIGPSAGQATVMLAGFCLGFAAGAESDIIAFMAARYFGMREYGRIYGLLYMPFGIFSSISPLAYGAIRDRTESYDLALGAAMVLFLFGGLLLLGLGRYPVFTAAAATGDHQ